jgi:ankyrin repeat protein
MLNACDDEEWRPLHFAASKGHTDICRFLVQHGAEIGAKDSAGNTALHLAAAKGHADTVEMLLSLHAPRAELNASNKSAMDVAATRRIGRALAGLARDLEEEKREDPVTGELRDENVVVVTPSAGPIGEGEFFDATKLYGLQFSDDDAVD